jgi:hypothetical protein
LCVVHDGAYDPKFGDKQDICLILRLKATIRDLEQALEDSTGRSTTAYAITSAEFVELNGTDPVFHNIPSGTFPRRHLRIAYHSGPEIAVIKVCCFLEDPNKRCSKVVEVSIKIQTRTLVYKLRSAVEVHLGTEFRLLFDGL